MSAPDGIESVLWSTCLRQLLFVSVEDLPSLRDGLLATDEVFQGLSALQLCLEIVTGLHSPILGETEVLGQFRERFLSLALPPSRFAIALQLFVKQVLTETKRVRQKHLTGQGSQSYGSTVRKLCKNQPEIRILGAGRLAREILPWIRGKSELTVVCRSLEKASSLREEYPELQIHALEGAAQPGSGALIVAAPMSREEILAWTARCGYPPQLIIDLRSNSEMDSLNDGAASFPRVYTLQLFFKEAARREKALTSRKNSALDEIRQICEELQRRVEVRPSGWDDLCA